MKIENVPVELSSVIEYSIDLITYQALQKRNCVGYIVKEGVPEKIHGDPTRLHQIIVYDFHNIYCVVD